MVTDTSKQAYRDLKDLSKRQRIVYDELVALERQAMGNSGRLPSNADVARMLDWPINEVTGRTNELRGYGWARVHGKKVDRFTGRTVQTICTANPNDAKLVDIFADGPKPGQAVRWMDDDE